MKYPLLKRFTHGLLDLFYPDLCVCCTRPLNREEQVICLHCSLGLPRTAFHMLDENKATDIFAGRIPVERAIAFVYFTKEGTVQQLLHHFKYKKKQQVGTILGRLYAADLSECDWIREVDVIIPVPLHRKKESSRGFNQAAVFATALGNALHIEVCTGALERIKHTVSQTTKSRKARLDNVSNVFRITSPGPVQHKHVLLIDDVLTTGATLESCALELLKIPGTRISIATIAIARD